GAADHAGADALGAVHGRDHRELAAPGDAVRGEGVAGPAEIGVARLVGDHHAAVGLGQLERPLDYLLRRVRRAAAIHRPASRTVLSTRIPRNTAVGQPCPTAATWP